MSKRFKSKRAASRKRFTRTAVRPVAPQRRRPQRGGIQL